MRDKARHPIARVLFGVAALGWRGARGTAAPPGAYLLLAGLATPLVVSVHTVVSFDFTITILPGWHRRSSRPTSWPGPSTPASPWLLTIAIPLRSFYKLQAT